MLRQEVETELLSIWAQPNKEGALTQQAAFKAKYGRLYLEAVRSLAEEEEQTLTFYEFPQTMHRYIRTTNAIESLFSNVRQHTDQIDVLMRRVELPDDRLGNHRECCLEKNPSRIAR